MESLDYNEVWRKVPLEEKLELISVAQASGMIALSGIILLSAAFAISLQMVELFWISFVVSPLGFQYASSRKYRHRRPLLMLRFLAARSAARRYAFSMGAEDLTLRLLFRGNCEKTFRSDKAEDNLEVAFNGTAIEKKVWIGLFNDAVIVLREGQGGAEMIFSGIINDRMVVTPTDPDLPDYASGRELIIDYKDKRYLMPTVKLSSPHSAAMVAFERGLSELYAQKNPVAEPEVLDAEPEEDF